MMRKEEEGKSAKKSGKKEKKTKQQKKEQLWFHGIVVREQLETFFGKMNRGKGSDAFSSDRNLP